MSETLQAALDRHRAGDFAEAERLYRRVLEREPGQVDALHLLGLLYLGQEHFEEAEQCVRQAVKLKRDPRFLASLGDILVLAEKWDGAREHYEGMSADGPESGLVAFNLGLAYRHLGQREQAYRHLERAIQLEPEHVDAFLQLGEMRQADSDWKTALTWFEQAIRLAPDRVEGFVGYANVLMDSGGVCGGGTGFRKGDGGVSGIAGVVVNNLGLVYGGLQRF